MWINIFFSKNAFCIEKNAIFAFPIKNRAV